MITKVLHFFSALIKTDQPILSTFDLTREGISLEDDGFRFTTHRVGDKNTGHDYGSCETQQLTFRKVGNPDPVPLPPLTPEQRWDLVEYLKTL